MRRILTTLAATSVAALIASSAGAACFDKHQQVMASTPQEETTVMSTHDGALPRLEEEKADKAEAAEPACAEGDKACEARTDK